MPVRVPRRTLLRSGLVASAAGSLTGLFSRRLRARGFGDLVADPAGVIDLPAGFSYRVLDATGDPMSDGLRVPGKPDGMMCWVNPDGTLVLTRNHELDSFQGLLGPLALDAAVPEAAYDSTSYGGVTRVVVDPSSLEVVSSNQVLYGTERNCAGGFSPWGWLTCEESNLDEHGYVFICDPAATTLQPPVRIDAYGRCRREGAVVDPHTMICYLTEDEGDGCLYRFRPHSPDAPFEGRLEALCVRGVGNFSAGFQARPGEALEVDWVRVPDPSAKSKAMRHQAQEQGAAVFARNEGIALGNGSVFFVSTAGGPQSSGQVFELQLGAGGDRLKLVAQADNSDVLDFPDNVTIAPWGDLYLCEDGSGDQFIRVLTPAGRIFDFARNAFSQSEIAGACFSPDGNILFCNLQHDGITLAITGPFDSLRPDEPLDAGRPSRVPYIPIVTAAPSGAGGDAGADAGTSQGTRPSGLPPTRRVERVTPSGGCRAGQGTGTGVVALGIGGSIAALAGRRVAHNIAHARRGPQAGESRRYAERKSQKPK